MRPIGISYLLLFTFIFNLSCKSNKSPKTKNLNEPITSFLHYDGKAWQSPRISVHRGGGELIGYPENCIESFTYISKKIPVFIECDVEISKDSTLFMMHDNTLNRTTTGGGKLIEKNWEEFKNEKLKDNFGNVTSYHIPLLSEVLQWSKNHSILTLDVKKNTPFTKVIAEVEKQKAQNNVVIITYNANEAKEVYELNPNLMISVGIMQIADYDRLKSLGIPDKNMIAFIGTREPKKELIDFLHSKGILTLLGTLGNLDKKALNSSKNLYQEWTAMGVDIVATDYPFEVNEALH